MKIGKDKVVSIEYTLKDSGGEVIDTSEGREPLDYIHGAGNIIPGLENALEGKASGEEITVAITPEEGYGARDESLIHVLDRDMFQVDGDLQVGMQFQAQTDAGVQILTITAVEDDGVTVDGNHPMAGQTLHFEVTVVGVRDATEEELSHSHPHSEGGGCC